MVVKALKNFVGFGEADKVLTKKFKFIRDNIKNKNKKVLSKEGKTKVILREDLENLGELTEPKDLSKEEMLAKIECIKGLR